MPEDAPKVPIPLSEDDLHHIETLLRDFSPLTNPLNSDQVLDLPANQRDAIVSATDATLRPIAALAVCVKAFLAAYPNPLVAAHRAAELRDVFSDALQTFGSVLATSANLPDLLRGSWGDDFPMLDEILLANRLIVEQVLGEALQEHESVAWGLER